ncbi:MAG: hypothetical protein DMF23_05625 [Verrucomicrobia bacterium]|nr:MAG: hypothetical protein DMF23_05625 [Verrucomicrobiota bacterium]
MWNFGYHLARFRGSVAREAYRLLLPMIVRRRIAFPTAPTAGAQFRFCSKSIPAFVSPTRGIFCCTRYLQATTSPTIQPANSLP